MVDLIGVTHASRDVCGLLDARDPNCVDHWCAGAARWTGVKGRAAGAVIDLASRVAPLRSIVMKQGIL